MKFGVIVSGTVHAAILGWSLMALGSQAPKFNIDLVIPEIDVDFKDDAALAKGDPKAAKSERPAPKPTKKLPELKKAKNVGDTKVDAKSKIKVATKEKPVEVKAPPPKPKEPAIKPVIKPVIKPDAEPQKAEKDSPVPTNKLASLNEPPAPVREKADEVPAKEQQAATEAKPAKIIKPAKAKPKQEKPKTAKTQQRKKPDEIKKAIEKAAAKKEEKETDDKLAALLNKVKPTATGAKKTTKKASLGSKKEGSAKRLSADQMNKLKETVANCSTGFGGGEISEDLAITVTVRLALDGTIMGKPQVQARGGTAAEQRRYSRDVLRYVKRCAPYNFLPKDQYDTWAILEPTFYPSEMFN